MLCGATKGAAEGDFVCATFQTWHTAKSAARKSLLALMIGMGLHVSDFLSTTRDYRPVTTGY